MLQAPDKLDNRVSLQPGCDHDGRSFAAKCFEWTRHPLQSCIKIAVIQALCSVEYFQVTVVLIGRQGVHLKARSALEMYRPGMCLCHIVGFVAERFPSFNVLAALDQRA